MPEGPQPHEFPPERCASKTQSANPQSSATRKQNRPRRIPNHQLRIHFLTHHVPIALLQRRIDPFHHDVHRQAAHRFHRLPHGRQRGRCQRRKRHVIESCHRTLLRHLHPPFLQPPNRTPRRYVVERHHRC